MMWNPVDRITRARRGAGAAGGAQETRTPHQDEVTVGLGGLTVADVPRFLRGLALLATGVETMLLPRRAVGDSAAPSPVAVATVSAEDTRPPSPAARTPGRPPARLAALQDRLSALSVPRPPGVTAATTRARAALVTTGHRVPTSGGARRVALGALLGVGILAVLLSPLRAWVWGRVRRMRSGTDGQDTISLVQTAPQDATVQQGTSGTPGGTSAVDDATLVDKVESAIFRDPAVPKGRININAERGRVVLRGEVDQSEQIGALDAAARQVPGVKDVENLLHLPGTPAPQS